MFCPWSAKFRGCGSGDALPDLLQSVCSQCLNQCWLGLGLTVFALLQLVSFSLLLVFSFGFFIWKIDVPIAAQSPRAFRQSESASSPSSLPSVFLQLVSGRRVDNLAVFG